MWPLLQGSGSPGFAVLEPPEGPSRQPSGGRTWPALRALLAGTRTLQASGQQVRGLRTSQAKDSYQDRVGSPRNWQEASLENGGKRSCSGPPDGRQGRAAAAPPAAASAGGGVSIPGGAPAPSALPGSLVSWRSSCPVQYCSGER